jgi:hypothetical protein
MKSLLLSLILSLSLIGCSTAPLIGSTPSIIVQYKYVSAPIPEEFLVIPAPVQALDLTNATQKSVADWLVRSEYRTKDLEDKLKLLKKNQDLQIINGADK